jgi:hypothetical protein
MTKRLASAFTALLLVAACGGSTQSTAPATPEPTPVAAADAGPPPPPDPATVKLTDAQCGEIFDHTIKLMEADPEEKPYVKSMKGERDKTMAQCLENGTKKDYDCMVAAKTMAEQSACKK